VRKTCRGISPAILSEQGRTAQGTLRASRPSAVLEERDQIVQAEHPGGLNADGIPAAGSAPLNSLTQEPVPSR
jgi:hypothetical protein